MTRPLSDPLCMQSLSYLNSKSKPFIFKSVLKDNHQSLGMKVFIWTKKLFEKVF